MSALEVVIGQVAGDVAACFEAILVFGHFEFNLDGSETRFHESVVVAVSARLMLWRMAARRSRARRQPNKAIQTRAQPTPLPPT